MLIKEFYVEKYKNLNDFRIDFGNCEGFTILVGSNGSGKSNILEVISAIFHDAYKSTNLYLGSANNFETDYFLTYTLDNKSLQIKNVNGMRRFFVDNLQVRRDRFIREGYLPRNVIGVYSGEESRLWTCFYEPYYKAYLKSIQSDSYQENMKLFFANKGYWNIALLVLLISRNESLVPFILDELKISGDIDISFDFDIEKIQHSTNALIVEMINRINPHLERQLILKRNVASDRFYERFDTDSTVFQFLVQAAMPDDNKLIRDVKIQFNNGVTTDVLSEGEKKLILIKAVLEFLADERTLVLFDEPDAHIHEARKRTLYDMILEYPNRQVIMTTHSPTFIDLAEENQIIMLKRGANGEVKIFDSSKLECMRYLTGSRFNAFIEKPILFCEGTGDSIEAKLYPVLFPDYQVIPSGGHEEVINHTKAYNRTFQQGSHFAIGIIDWDYRTEDQLMAFKEENIYSLRVVEIENVLMDAQLLQSAQEQFCAEDGSFERVVRCFFEACSAEKLMQATKYTSNFIVSHIKAELSPENRNIERFKSKVSTICTIANIDHLYQERIDKVDELLRSASYDELVSIFDFNHHIDRFMTQPIVNEYTKKILRLVAKNETLRLYLKQKYYNEVPEAE